MSLQTGRGCSFETPAARRTLVQTTDRAGRRRLPGAGRGAWIGLVVPLALLGLAGCAEGPRPESQPTAAVSRAPGAAATPPADNSRGGAAVPPAAERKIIYNAQVSLVVESLSAFEKTFAKLVKDSGGYVSQTDQSTHSESRRSGNWTVRVPVDRFDGFLAAVGRLGELQQSHLDSQDVTQEYYDIEARIANKQQEEKRLLKHLSDSTGKLEDILAVERELSRVRGEIEQMQGRIRYLANLSALSTVTVNVTEIHNYTPPVHPTFAAQVARTFHGSLEQLVAFGKGVVLLAVAVAPWLPVVLVVVLPLVWSVRRLRREGSGPVVVAPRAGP